MTTQQQYLEILFPKNLDTEDLTITKRPTAEQPGQAKLNRAQVSGPAVNSWTGPKIGFLTDELIKPFFETFEIR